MLTTLITVVNHLLNRGQIQTNALQPTSVVLLAVTLSEAFLSTAEDFTELFL